MDEISSGCRIFEPLSSRHARLGRMLFLCCPCTLCTGTHACTSLSQLLVPRQPELHRARSCSWSLINVKPLTKRLTTAVDWSNVGEISKKLRNSVNLHRVNSSSVVPSKTLRRFCPVCSVLVGFFFCLLPERPVL